MKKKWRCTIILFSILVLAGCRGSVEKNHVDVNKNKVVAASESSQETDSDGAEIGDNDEISTEESIEDSAFESKEAETFFETEDVSQSKEIDEDYYSVATFSSAEEVEQYAMNIKKNILENDWAALSEKIAYPITIDEVTISDSSAFLEMDLDNNISSEFVDAIKAESCHEMFCNWRGVSMGSTGQIWFSSVGAENGEFELKIVGINEIFD